MRHRGVLACYRRRRQTPESITSLALLRLVGGGPVITTMKTDMMEVSRLPQSNKCGAVLGRCVQWSSVVIGCDRCFVMLDGWSD